MPAPRADRPEVALTADTLAASDHDVVAVALIDGPGGDPGLGPGSAELAEHLGVDLADLAELARTGRGAGQVTSLPLPGRLVHVVDVGAGAPADLLRAGAALARRTKGVDQVASTVSSVGGAEHLTAFVTGYLLGGFEFTMRTDERPGPARLILAGTGPDDETVLARALVIAGASRTARRWATVPSNVKSPQWLADEIREHVEAAGLRTRLWDADALTEDGFGGIAAVGRGSDSPPCLLAVEYRPRRRPRKARHLALVGKGITFDSGGLSIKPGQAMVNMKRDMTGAAVVAATMAALPELDCPVRVTALLPIAENSISGSAMRPGDVITHWGGRTTEVVNTDAEGRLVLADALRYAVDELDADAVADIATLTGGIKVALGLSTGGYFTNREALVAHVERASAASGERIWRMPLAPEYDELLASTTADAINAPGKAPAITAALFLQHFVDDRPWLHFDIASVGDSASDNAEWTTGPTGFGVRLLLAWLTADDPLEGVDP